MLVWERFSVWTMHVELGCGDYGMLLEVIQLFFWVLGSYLFGCTLGYAVVKKGIDKQTGETVAIKVGRP